MAAVLLPSSVGALQRGSLVVLSQRCFARAGVPRPRKKKARDFKRGIPRKGEKKDLSGTRTLSAKPWGPPRYPIPRVQETSVEFSQNINSLCRLAIHKLQCLNLTVSHRSHSSKAAVERLLHYADIIRDKVTYIHLYQFVIVTDILGYSRDMGSRNTLWIPDDFTVAELIDYLCKQCMADPKLAPIRRIDSFMNPFQPMNWSEVDKLEHLDGHISRARKFPIPENEYYEAEPLELVRLREKARNVTFPNESYFDQTDFFSYWQVPGAQEAQGDSVDVPEYKVPSQSTHIEFTESYESQIDDVSDKFERALTERQRKLLATLSEEDKVKWLQLYDDYSIRSEYKRNDNVMFTKEGEMIELSTDEETTPTVESDTDATDIGDTTKAV